MREIVGKMLMRVLGSRKQSGNSLEEDVCATLCGGTLLLKNSTLNEGQQTRKQANNMTNRPTIILKDNKTDISADISAVYHTIHTHTLFCF